MVHNCSAGRNIASRVAAARFAGASNPCVAEASQLNAAHGKAAEKNIEKAKVRDDAKLKDKTVFDCNVHKQVVPTVIHQLPGSCDSDASRHPADRDVILFGRIGDLNNKIGHRCLASGAALQVDTQSTFLVWLFGKHACILSWFEKQGGQQSVKCARFGIKQFGWHFAPTFEGIPKHCDFDP